MYNFLKEMVRKSRVDLLSHGLCEGYLKMKWFSTFLLKTGLNFTIFLLKIISASLSNSPCNFRSAYGWIDYMLSMIFQIGFVILFFIVISTNNVACHIELEESESLCKSSGWINCTDVKNEVLQKEICKVGLINQIFLIALITMAVIGAVFELLSIFYLVCSFSFS